MLDNVSRDSTDLSGTTSSSRSVLFFCFSSSCLLPSHHPSHLSHLPIPISHLPPCPLFAIAAAAAVCSFPQNSTDGIRVSLRQIIAEQNRFRVREARHRYTADSNLILVTGFSFVNLVVMGTAAVTQVVVLRVVQGVQKEQNQDLTTPVP